MVLMRTTSVWEGLGKSPKITQLYFETDAPDAVAAVSETHAILDSIKGAWCSSSRVQVRGLVEQIAPTTGALIALTAAPDPAVIVGTSPDEQAADATQYLIRWRTGAVVRGRRLQGRTFIPAVPSTALDNGNIGEAQAAAMAAALQAVLDSGSHLAIWSRPTTLGGSDGVAHQVITADVWREAAVQRRRRG